MNQKTLLSKIFRLYRVKRGGKGRMSLLRSVVAQVSSMYHKIADLEQEIDDALEMAVRRYNDNKVLKAEIVRLQKTLDATNDFANHVKYELLRSGLKTSVNLLPSFSRSLASRLVTRPDDHVFENVTFRSVTVSVAGLYRTIEYVVQDNPLFNVSSNALSMLAVRRAADELSASIAKDVSEQIYQQLVSWLQPTTKTAEVK
jgi:uncharacterized protein (UPF0335 family)